MYRLYNMYARRDYKQRPGFTGHLGPQLHIFRPLGPVYALVIISI